MKRIITILIALFVYSAQSQNSDYANRMEHIFENIDPAKVTTGYLKDFGIRFANMGLVNGEITAQNPVSKPEFINIYNSLYSMRVGTPSSGMLAPGTFKTDLSNQQSTASADVLLAVQHYNYNQYKENAYVNGDVAIIDDQIYDQTGRNP
ncbi:MAG: hypothetical protein ACSHWW_01165 [Nonlabens sp.]|uniref:hypothetical protein n=1 Tax=Nonlabens sp. TaxID=1888209 RepID=UPI003EFA818D